MMLENKAIAVFEDLLRAGLWGTPLNGLWKELKAEFNLQMQQNSD